MNIEQTELVGIEVLAYRSGGMLYVIFGQRLYQVDHNHFLEFMPGTEVYGSLVRRLKKQIPIPHSELESILSKLLKTIKDIMYAKPNAEGLDAI